MTARQKLDMILESKFDFESTILALFNKPSPTEYLNFSPLIMLILGEKSWFLEPTIFEVPQPN